MTRARSSSSPGTTTRSRSSRAARGGRDLDAAAFSDWLLSRTDMRVLILGSTASFGNALTRRILTTTDWEVFGSTWERSGSRSSSASRASGSSRGDIDHQPGVESSTTSRRRTSSSLVAIATPYGLREGPPLRLRARLRGEPSGSSRWRGSTGRGSSSPPRRRSTECARRRSSTRHLAPRLRADPEGAVDLLRPRSSSSTGSLGDGALTGAPLHLFRPFNWYGPHLDDVDAPKEGRAAS